MDKVALARLRGRGWQWRHWLIDALLVNLSLVVAFELSYNFKLPAGSHWQLGIYSPLLTALSLVLLSWRGLYRAQIRYIGLYDFLNIVWVSFALAILLGIGEGLLTWQLGGIFLWVTPVLFGLLVNSTLIGVRVAQRLYAWRALSPDRQRERRRTLIVGAGDAGEMIARQIARSWGPLHLLIGFVDDDPAKASLVIHGVPVLGTTADIPALVENHAIEEILIAMPSARGHDIRRIFDLCRRTSARVRILPALPSILEGSAHLYQFREVEIEDLLPREPIKTNWKEVATYLSGERVLITGAGGSIGSELARQIVMLGPATLLLLGKGENSIYEIEQELIQSFGFHPTPIIADVKDAVRMEAVFRRERPTVIFHTAAHKHVPLMEANPTEAIKNNLLGTLVTAELAIRYGIKKFIYVSTDKAVNPTSIMGATKRVGEMIISALAAHSNTGFATVRFGNVLGSRGSLIPMLKAQIARGGPVRITHPEMTRYFMTIPESVQLIIQAGALGQNGEIFILDMGQPVRILDLAYDLIRLHGLVPGEDIQIEYTGVRPGEKLHEELYDEAEILYETKHPKILMARNHNHLDWKWLQGELESLFHLCDADQMERAREYLMELAWGKRIPTQAMQG